MSHFNKHVIFNTVIAGFVLISISGVESSNAADKFSACEQSPYTVEGPAARMTEALYLAMLGRQADIPGACGYYSEVRDLGLSGMERGTVWMSDSEEFANRFPDLVTSAEAVLKQLYRGFLLRDPDPSGMESYLPVIRGEVQGESVSSVAIAILNSEEFRVKFLTDLSALPVSIDRPFRNCDYLRDQLISWESAYYVELVYLAVLGREMEIPGGCSWYPTIEQSGHAGLVEVAHAFVDSDEFKINFGPRPETAEVILDQFYELLLKREKDPTSGRYYDPSGGESYLPIIRGEVPDVGVKDVLTSILSSEEFRFKHPDLDDGFDSYIAPPRVIHPDPTPTPVPQFDPKLYRKGTKIYGNSLLGVQADGSGALIGIGKYAVITDRTIATSSVRELFCYISDLGFNYFRTFTALGVGDRREDFVSPWENTAEWKQKRNELLDAALECGIYVQLSMYDELERNDPERRGEGYKRSDNSWKGKDPSFEVAKQLSRDYYLAGLDPNSLRGKVLIPELANEPADNWWQPKWDDPNSPSTSLVLFLNSLGWKFIGSNANDRAAADKVEWHFKKDEMSTAISVAREQRGEFQRPFAVSTDGAGYLSPSTMGKVMKDGIANQISVEFLMSGLDPFNLDRPVSEGEWKGKTTREYLRQLAMAAGL